MLDHRTTIGLLETRGLGRKTVQKLIDADATATVRGLVDLLARARQQGAKRIPRPTDAELAAGLDNADRIIDACNTKGFAILGPHRIPQRLRQFDDPPVLLYCKGDAQLLEVNRAAAVIGTRKPTDAGAAAARQLGARLAAESILVVSGLALGCDAAGHEGALESGGRNVAFLAYGLDQPVSPRCNEQLAQRILDGGGALVSEYPPGTTASGHPARFIERDRLQAALASLVLVIETGPKGGTWFAVDHGHTNGRRLAVWVHPAGQPPLAEIIQGRQALLELGAAPIRHQDELAALFEITP